MTDNDFDYILESSDDEIETESFITNPISGRPFKATVLYRLGDLIRRWRVVQLVAHEGRLNFFLQSMSRDPMGGIFFHDILPDGIDVTVVDGEEVPDSELVDIGSPVLRIRTHLRVLYFSHERRSHLLEWARYLQVVADEARQHSIDLKVPAPPMLSGYLWKQGGIVKNWKRRYFSLKDSKLTYREHPLDKGSKGSIDLRDVERVELFVTEERVLNPVGAVLRTAKRTYYLYDTNEEFLEDWIDVLFEIVHSKYAVAQNSTKKSKSTLSLIGKFVESTIHKPTANSSSQSSSNDEEKPFDPFSSPLYTVHGDIVKVTFEGKKYPLAFLNQQDLLSQNLWIDVDIYLVLYEDTTMNSEKGIAEKDFENIDNLNPLNAHCTLVSQMETTLLDEADTFSGNGTLSYDTIRSLIKDGYIIRLPGFSPGECTLQNLDESQIQPASFDLTLSSLGYKLPGSVLPRETETVQQLLLQLNRAHEIDLSAPYTLDRNRVYLIQVREEFHLPRNVAAYTNSKSSTGRLDLSTRTVCDFNPRYDKIRTGYCGTVWLQVTSRSFDIVVQAGMSLNQAIFYTDRQLLSSFDMQRLYEERGGLLYERSGNPIPIESCFFEDGLLLTIDLDQDVVGYVAKKTFHEVNMALVGMHEPSDFFDPIFRPRDGFLWLEKGRFYIFSTYEYIRVPSDFAVEMMAFDTTSGEFRAHYAGFFDPGFGHGEDGEVKGTPAVLEVRAYEDDLVVRHRQPIARMVYEKLDRRPTKIYASSFGSNYANQRGPRLSKHFGELKSGSEQNQESFVTDT